MSAGLGRPLSSTFRSIALAAAVVLVWAGSQITARLVSARPPDPAARARVGAELQQQFEELLERTAAVARSALAGSPWRAEDLARRSGLGDRLEGVGVLDAEGSYLHWQGTPVEPSAALIDVDAPEWMLRLDGVRTRLIVRAGPNDYGFLALAAFLLDSTLGDLDAAELLGPIADDAGMRIRFLDTEVLYGAALADRTARLELGEEERRALEERSAGEIALLSPGGELMGLARIELLPAPLRGRELKLAGEAWTAVLLALGLALLFRWRAIVRTLPGLATALAALALARAALRVFDVGGRLLPRELGSPSVFGSPALAGLFGSPADLLLSCLGLYLACAALRVHVRVLAARRPFRALALALAGALAATAATWGVTALLGRDSRLQLPSLEALREVPAAVPLQLGWVLAILAAAELWGSVWTLSAASRNRDRGLPTRRAVAVAALPVSLVAAAVIGAVGDRLALERLRLEFVPQVLDQSAHRRLALSAAVRHAAEGLEHPDASIVERGFHPDFLAFSLWVEGDLYHAGYKSSLDLYGLHGDLLSHFGFDVPSLQENVAPPEELPDEPVIFAEETVVGALPRRLLHAQLPVRREGVPVGVVVGHVLDELGNLPFLPASQPFLAALGPRAPDPREKLGPAAPGYVLYDRRGTVLLRTVEQPPTLTREMEMAATQHRTVRVVAGEESYAALPVLDGDLLHLLLHRARTPLERLGAFVRVALMALGVLLVLFLAANAFRGGGLERLSRAVRGSFYRKLLATLLLASIVPLIGLSLFVRGYIESRGDATLESAAVQYVSVAQRVVEDFLATGHDREGEPLELTDDTLHWLRRLVEQEIHVYRNGRLEASSKRGLFDSGLLALRLPGEVEERLVRGGLPYLVRPTRLGKVTIPVAYAPLGAPGTAESLVVAVPLTLQHEEIARAVDRVAEVLLLATVALAGLLAVAAAVLARTVARPVRELVGATARIAAGDYSTRLEAGTRDEIAELVESFNSMASSLAAQRRDLEQRRDYMEALLRNATAGVVSTDAAGKVVTVNPAMTRLLGLPADGLRPGENLVEGIAAHDELQPLAQQLALPRHRWDEPREVDLERRGRPRRFRVVRVDLPDPWGGAPGSLILMDDVTDLMRSNQLAAWAEMARAIAHEIKNPLTPIQLSTEHLERLLRDRGVLPAPEVASCLETVIKQVRALREIAAEFSAYAKLPVLEPEPQDPVTFMRETIAPYRSGQPPGITIEEDYRPSPRVSIDRRVLGRAVINLVENALQAMPDGGRLTVSVSPDSRNGAVVLTVRDTGVGLAPDVRARLFEPYFSTKSSGTGLGLAIVRRAVDAHRGSIEVESESGRGTAIHIRLPSFGDGDP